MSQSEFIDTLAFAPKGAPYFIVNTAAASVDVRIPAWTGDQYQYWLYSAGGFSKFKAGDSMTILSMGYVLPESFIMAQAPVGATQNVPSIAIGLSKVGLGMGVFFLPNFMTTGVQVPIENYELPVNIFADVNQVNPPTYDFRTTNFGLYCVLRGLNENPPPTVWPQVSMIGCPPSLHGTTQRLTVFVKVLHNFALVG